MASKIVVSSGLFILNFIWIWKDSKLQDCGWGIQNREAWERLSRAIWWCMGWERVRKGW